MNVSDPDEKKGKGAVFVEGSPQKACDRIKDTGRTMV
ncbi:hypothetical protein CLV97_12726 [Planifilum fimeticola]|uniref:Uncharacterized protein n=1 Tax=Planifilum fimeticola TaxID=201975 RepID=A0A2T0LBE9_9BACL|nr:hypothetical protein CLV97_12726 [Planifilum fimeticola]